MNDQEKKILFVGALLVCLGLLFKTDKPKEEKPKTVDAKPEDVEILDELVIDEEEEPEPEPEPEPEKTEEEPLKVDE